LVAHGQHIGTSTGGGGEGIHNEIRRIGFPSIALEGNPILGDAGRLYARLLLIRKAIQNRGEYGINMMPTLDGITQFLSGTCRFKMNMMAAEKNKKQRRNYDDYGSWTGQMAGSSGDRQSMLNKLMFQEESLLQNTVLEVCETV